MLARKRKTASLATEQEADNQASGKQCMAQSNGGGTEQDIVQREFKSQYFSCKSDNLKLGEDFFNQPCVCLAKALLGKVLVRRCADGLELRGRVVETEAYLGGEDKASHSACGKRTERNLAMFMKPGTIYVYPIYGIYLCMNISSQGEGAAVLLRSLEPLQGHAVMRRLRGARRKESSRPLKEKELCNGPSKLCQALDVPRAFDRRDLADDPDVWLERDPEERPLQEGEMVTSRRVGIESHGEWAAKPLRFYLRGHPCVSVLDRRAEKGAPLCECAGRGHPCVSVLDRRAEEGAPLCECAGRGHPCVSVLGRRAEEGAPLCECAGQESRGGGCAHAAWGSDFSGTDHNLLDAEKAINK